MVREVSSSTGAAGSSAARISGVTLTFSPSATTSMPETPARTGRTATLPPRGSASPASTSILQARRCQSLGSVAPPASRRAAAAGIRAVGEAIELQPLACLAGALADQPDGVADEVGIFLAEQFDAVVDRADRAHQLVAQPRIQQLDHAHLDQHAHIAAIPCSPPGGLPGSSAFPL